MKSNSLSKVLSVLLVLAMLLSYIPAVATAQAINTPRLVTVDQAVQDEMQKSGVATYWVEFNNTADLSPAYSLNWQDRGWFVYETLKEQADRTQAQAIQMLESSRTTYKSFWINNSILVSQSNNQVLSSLQSLPNVTAISAQKEYILYEPENLPTDGNSPKSAEPGLGQVKAPAAWDLGYTGQGLVIANIDTGVRYSHQALVNSYRGNNGDGTFTHDYNWFNPINHSDNVPRDGHIYGHGTHTIGTIVGDDGGNNQIGIAPGAQWFACAGCPDGNCPDSALLACGEFITAPTTTDGSNPNPDMRANVVNNSWGDCGQSYNNWYEGVINAWLAAGIYPVFANGNSHNCKYPSNPPLNTVGNPARTGKVTGVGSSNTTGGTYAVHSNKGPTDNLDTINPTDGYDMLKPQVVAPGSYIRSSYNSGDDAYISNGGTSMSAPHVSGLVALVLQAAPCLLGNYAVIENLIESTATPIIYNDGSDLTPTNYPNFATGWGEINALAAVQAASTMCPSGTISGTIKDTDGIGIPNAKLQFTGTKGYTDKTVYTNEQGEFSTLIFPDTFKLTVSILGYSPYVEENITVENDAVITKDGVLTILPTATVSGVVTDGGITDSTDKHGYPLYAKLSFSSDGQTTEIFTDPFTGAYSLDIFQNTVYSVSVEALTTEYLMHFDTLSTTQSALTLDVELKVPAFSCTTAGYFSEGNGSCFDNNMVNDLNCEIVSGGIVAGYVTDADHGNPRLMDASVESDLGFGTTSASLNPTANGLYWFFQPTTASEDNVSFTVTKTGFDPIIETRTVKKDLINRHDFQLSNVDKLVANPDEYSMVMNSRLNVTVGEGILANDIHQSGLPVYAVLVGGVASGELTLNPDGSFIYTPNENFHGVDQFTYQISDGINLSNTVSVTLDVETRLIANPDAYSGNSNHSLFVPVSEGILENDLNPTQDALTITVVENVSSGVLELNQDGSFVYTPSPNSYGTDIFSYKISTSNLESNVATVELKIKPQLVAIWDEYSMVMNRSLNVVVGEGLLVNDINPSGLPVNLVLVSNVASGNLTLNQNGSFIYIPKQNFYGTDSFTYQLKSGLYESNTVSVSLYVGQSINSAFSLFLPLILN